METVDILARYKVYIGSGILSNISEIINTQNFSKVTVITDEKIPDKFLNRFEKITVPSGENYKNIETVQVIWKKLLEMKIDRKALVINLGGGVVGDMGGFAASTFMRGLKFIQAPTTVLSAVDASVGGKVGIDFANVKNLVGTFNQPLAVLVDVDTFESLTDREFISGFGEIIKHGIIADAGYFKKVTSKKPKDFTKDELIEIIRRSCEIKAEIVSGDEKESGKRKLLNFGHTIGHALESASLETGRSLLHGEAVSIGIIAESKISQSLGLISEEQVSEITKALENAGLPVKYKIIDLEKIIDLLSKDKKTEAGKINWTLVDGIGSARINQFVDKEKVESALHYISL